MATAAKAMAERPVMVEVEDKVTDDITLIKWQGTMILT